jgi:hypothetical protein
VFNLLGDILYHSKEFSGPVPIEFTVLLRSLLLHATPQRDSLPCLFFWFYYSTHQLHNFCSICEADILKKPDQRYLIAHQPGQPAFLQNALKVKCTVMCIIIKSYRFGGVFQHIFLTFYATFRSTCSTWNIYHKY